MVNGRPASMAFRADANRCPATVCLQTVRGGARCIWPWTPPLRTSGITAGHSGNAGPDTTPEAGSRRRCRRRFARTCGAQPARPQGFWLTHRRRYPDQKTAEIPTRVALMNRFSVPDLSVDAQDAQGVPSSDRAAKTNTLPKMPASPTRFQIGPGHKSGQARQAVEIRHKPGQVSARSGAMPGLPLPGRKTPSHLAPMAPGLADTCTTA